MLVSRFRVTTAQTRFFSRSFLQHGKVLVVADHDNKNLRSSTLNAVTAASQLGDVEVLVLGSNCTSVASAASNVKGVTKVVHVDSADLEHPTAERVTQVVLSEHSKNKYSHLLSPSNAFGKDFVPRVGALLDVQPISDVQKIESQDVFVRPIYAGNAILKLKSLDPVKVLTIRTTGFAPADASGGSAQVEASAPPAPSNLRSKWISDQLQVSERPELTSAERVVSGGRGLKNKENFSLIYDLADQMKAGVGASRAVVDAGFVPNDLQVGQTGKIVAPTLYVAVGISGAIQHLAGMKGSKTIVAINNDPDAPIFQVADYGLVDDLFKAVPELIDELKK
eukprot:TRINITY_DN2090_c0_g1_i1.p1 TRINITY_DN2090_c0_g1~~TRINITY_DN2090_c0_g1_i1.p1  ORF type:complete len:337 (+),score=33.98 TRINITY_DN2090_c0_g1_i1:57-1067(+)